MTARKVAGATHDYVEVVQPHDDFLAFWRQKRAKDKPEVKQILGVEVAVPTDMPLGMQDLAEELMDSEDPRDIERLVAMLYGPLVYDQWKANGVTVEMLGVLLTWGMSNAAGKPCTFEEAAALAEEIEQGKAPKATPNRAARRAKPRASSATRASGRTGR